MTQIQIMYLIGGAAGLLLVVAITLLVVRSRLKAELAALAHLAQMQKTSLEEKLEDVRLQLATVRADLAAAEGQLDQRRDAMAELEAQKAALVQTVTRIPVLEEALEKADAPRNNSTQLTCPWKKSCRPCLPSWMPSVGRPKRRF